VESTREDEMKIQREKLDNCEECGGSVFYKVTHRHILTMAQLIEAKIVVPSPPIALREWRA
jgi:hypothetical protein